MERKYLTKKLFYKSVNTKKDLGYLRNDLNSNDTYFFTKYKMEALKELSYYDSWAYELNFDLMDNLWVKNSIHLSNHVFKIYFSNLKDESDYEYYKGVEKILGDEIRVLNSIINNSNRATCDCPYYNYYKHKECTDAVNEGRCPYLKKRNVKKSV